MTQKYQWFGVGFLVLLVVSFLMRARVTEAFTEMHPSRCPQWIYDPFDRFYIDHQKELRLWPNEHVVQVKCRTCEGRRNCSGEREIVAHVTLITNTFREERPMIAVRYRKDGLMDVTLNHYTFTERPKY